MDCKNFDTSDDMCKGCLSGGTSVNQKEQECYEEIKNIIDNASAKTS